MEAANLQIYWHESQPVYSLTFPPKSQYDPNLPKLFTAGGDNKIRIWNLNTVKSTTNDSCLKIDTIDFLTSLQQHEQAINVVRFNSKGDILASAGDDGQILLWKRNIKGQPTTTTTTSDIPSTLFGFDADAENGNNNSNDESWYVWKRLRFHSHASEIYDLTWSPCDQYILCGCMDNFIRIFQINSGGKQEEENEPKCIISLKEHNHYVQGVTWDPLNKYILSQSTDRSINIYKLIFHEETGGLIDLKLQTKILKFERSYMYHNETLPSFFRRLTISPCGNLIVCPTGLTKPTTSTPTNSVNSPDGTNCVYIYGRSTLIDGYNKPIIRISNLKKPALIISFNPIFYQISNTTSNGMVSLPYKLIFAIATSNEILIYETTNIEPIGIIGNLHYTPLTDLAWSPDGKFLMISSTDGFCSYISIDPSLFGPELSEEEINKLSPSPSIHQKIKVEDKSDKPVKSEKKDIINILPVKRKVKPVNTNTSTTTTTTSNDTNPCRVTETTKPAIQSTLPLFSTPDDSPVKRQKISVTLHSDPIEEDLP